MNYINHKHFKPHVYEKYWVMWFRHIERVDNQEGFIGRRGNVYFEAHLFRTVHWIHLPLPPLVQPPLGDQFAHLDEVECR